VARDSAEINVYISIIFIYIFVFLSDVKTRLDSVVQITFPRGVFFYFGFFSRNVFCFFVISRSPVLGVTELGVSKMS